MKNKFLVLVGIVCLLVLSFAYLPFEVAENEIIIQTSRRGHITNVDLVYAKDGLTGEWTKLTGINGVYKFKVENSDGLYSVVAVSSTEVALFNASIFEIKNVFLTFNNAIEEDFSTLTIEFPLTFSDKKVSVFFLGEYSFPPMEGNKVGSRLPKGTGDLVIYVDDLLEVPESIRKIAIFRDFEFYNDKVITILSEQLFDSVEKVPFEGIDFGFWLVGLTTNTFSVVWDDNRILIKAYAIPEVLKSCEDLYGFGAWNFNIENGGPCYYYEYTMDYPESKPFDLTTITLQPLPETPFSTQTSESGNLIINVTKHNVGLTDMKTVVYEFAVERYNQLDPQAAHVVYYLTLSSKYVDETNGRYEFPVINDEEFAEYLIKDNQKVYLLGVITTSGELKDLYFPFDGLKVIIQSQQ